jgi:hypothetical protein
MKGNLKEVKEKFRKAISNNKIEDALEIIENAIKDCEDEQERGVLYNDAANQFYALVIEKQTNFKEALEYIDKYLELMHDHFPYYEPFFLIMKANVKFMQFHKQTCEWQEENKKIVRNEIINNFFMALHRNILSSKVSDSRKTDFFSSQCLHSYAEFLPFIEDSNLFGDELAAFKKNKKIIDNLLLSILDVDLIKWKEKPEYKSLPSLAISEVARHKNMDDSLSKYIIYMYLSAIYPGNIEAFEILVKCGESIGLTIANSIVLQGNIDEKFKSLKEALNLNASYLIYKEQEKQKGEMVTKFHVGSLGTSREEYVVSDLYKIGSKRDAIVDGKAMDFVINSVLNVKFESESSKQPVPSESKEEIDSQPSTPISSPISSPVSSAVRRRQLQNSSKVLTETSLQNGNPLTENLKCDVKPNQSIMERFSNLVSCISEVFTQPGCPTCRIPFSEYFSDPKDGEIKAPVSQVPGK